MHYLPTDYNIHPFIALIVAGAIAAICGSIACALSVVRWSFAGRIELGRKKTVRNTPPH